MLRNPILIVLFGFIVLILSSFYSCSLFEKNDPPTASFTVSPNSGITETNFVFDASGSTDNEDSGSQLQVRWDFNGDGSWDTNWDYNKTQNTQYGSEGTYTAKLEVMDSEGLKDETTQTVTVTNNGGSTGTFNDPRDGKTYITTEIGSQTWFAENLDFETTDSWWHNNDLAMGALYGRLYLWESAKVACPGGWHLPTDGDWKKLELALGMSQSEVDKESGYRGTDEGKKLKATSGWEENGHGTNSSGFSALPGGFRLVDGSFSLTGYVAWWWSATEYDIQGALNRSLGYSYDQIERDEDHKLGGLSVRCVKD